MYLMRMRPIIIVYQSSVTGPLDYVILSGLDLPNVLHLFLTLTYHFHFQFIYLPHTEEIIGQTGLYLVSLSSKTHVAFFKTKWLGISQFDYFFCAYDESASSPILKF